MILLTLGTHRAQRNLLAVLLAVAVFLLLRRCDDGDVDNARTMYTQNTAALTDSVRTYRNRMGKLVFEKNSLLTDVSDLRALNAELYREIKSLRDNPLIITKYTVRIQRDTVYLHPAVDSSGIDVVDGRVLVPFVWKTDTTYGAGNSRHLAGKYIIDAPCVGALTRSFSITRDSMSMSFFTGVTENRQGLLEIFIRSDFPGFSASHIDGAVLDPRKSKVISSFFPPKRWSVGPYVGYGAYVSPDGRFGHGLGAGVSVQYGVWQWQAKKK